MIRFLVIRRLYEKIQTHLNSNFERTDRPSWANWQVFAQQRDERAMNEGQLSPIGTRISSFEAANVAFVAIGPRSLPNGLGG